MFGSDIRETENRIINACAARIPETECMTEKKIHKFREMETLSQIQSVYAKWEKRSGLIPGQKSRPIPAEYTTMMEEGRQAWRKKFQDAGHPPPSYRRTRQKYKNGRMDFALPVGNVQMSNLAYFKTTPTILPATEKYRRPFAARCCSCMPNSRECLYESNMETQGLHNILNVNTRRSENSWLVRTFDQITFSMRRTINHKYPNVSLAVLTSPRIVEAIQKSARQELGVGDDESVDEKKLKRAVQKHEKRAHKVVLRMSAAISNALIRFTGWFLHKFLSHLYSTIIVHKGQIEMLKDATKRKLPIVFLPTHRSHMDYILLTFMMFNFDIQAPHVAAGDNLLIPFFSALMRGLGGYFIRRKLDGSLNGKKDIVYRAILHTYMEELLKRGEYFEFFLEGGRSRSGKVLYPKGGLLSVVVDAYLSGMVPDVYIVPVNFSYEKLLEGSYSGEQMGEPKQKETFWGAWKAIWGVMRSHFGNVRIDFGQPFSIKEYLQVAQSYGSDQYQTSQWDGEAGSPPRSRLELSDSSGSLFGMDDHRNTIQGMAEHVLYNCQTVQAMMSTHLLAFLLLTKHRQGARLRDLSVSFDWLREEMASHRRDVGFSGKTAHVVLHASDLLGKHLVQREPPTNSQRKEFEDQNNNTSEELFICPTTSLPHVFELSYYANPVMAIFALESVTAAAVCAEAGDAIWAGSGQDQEVTISKNAVLQRAADLCHILQYEFIFKPPCASWDSVLTDAVESLCVYEVLQVAEEETGDGREAEWARRLSSSLSWANEESDEEDTAIEDTLYKVRVDSEFAMSRLRFLLHVLGPVLEAYHIITCSIPPLQDKPQAEGKFISEVHTKLKTRVQDGIATYAESCAMDTVRNAVHSLQQLRVVESYTDNNIKMIKYTKRASPVTNSSRLGQIIDHLEACRVLNMV